MPLLPVIASTRPPETLAADPEQHETAAHQDGEGEVDDLDGLAAAGASKVEQHRYSVFEMVVVRELVVVGGRELGFLAGASPRGATIEQAMPRG